MTAENLSAAAQAILAALFMDDGTKVTFGNEENRLAPKASEAMSELMLEGLVEAQKADDFRATSITYSLTEKGKKTDRVKSQSWMNKYARFKLTAPLGSNEQIATMAQYQEQAAKWSLECFGETTANDITERNYRFVEEALELVQSRGATAEDAHSLVDYVFGRDKGEPFQEIGGVMVTLALLVQASGLSLEQAALAELTRIEQPEVMDRVRAKHATKPHKSPLPGDGSPPDGLEPLYHCESCTKPIYPGDEYCPAGDLVCMCAEHAYSLSDVIQAYEKELTKPEPDFEEFLYDSREEMEKALADLKEDLTDNGDRKILITA